MSQANCWVCGSDVESDDNYCRKCGVALTRLAKTGKKDTNFPISSKRRQLGLFMVLFGAILGLLSYLSRIDPLVALGFASFLIGAMILYLPEPKNIWTKFLAESSLPALLNIENLLEDLDLDQRGIYLPTSGIGISPKVFLPLSETPATVRPPLGLNNSRRVFVTVGKNPEDRGILLDPPGSQILAAMEHSLRMDLSKSDLDSLEQNMDFAFRRLGLARVTSLNKKDPNIRVDLEITAFAEFEEKLRNLAPRLVAQIGTPISSAVAASVAKSSGKYVRFKSAILQLPDSRVTVSLRLMD